MGFVFWFFFQYFNNLFKNCHKNILIFLFNHIKYCQTQFLFIYIFSLFQNQIHSKCMAIHTFALGVHNIIIFYFRKNLINRLGNYHFILSYTSYLDLSYYFYLSILVILNKVSKVSFSLYSLGLGKIAVAHSLIKSLRVTSFVNRYHSYDFVLFRKYTPK